eukprot:6130334-Amphidinium_carterae.2
MQAELHSTSSAAIPIRARCTEHTKMQHTLIAEWPRSHLQDGALNGKQEEEYPHMSWPQPYSSIKFNGCNKHGYMHANDMGATYRCNTT